MIKKIGICFFCILLFISSYALSSTDSEAGNLELAPQLANNRELATIVFSPDGNTIAAMDNVRASIELWNAQGYFLRAWPHPFNRGGKFSSSGRFFASFDSRDVIIRDTGNGKQLNKFAVPLSQTPMISAIDFNPDDSLLALSGDDAISIWDLKKNMPIVNDGGAHDGKLIRDLSFADGGNAIVTYSKDTISILNLQGHVTKVLHVAGIADIFVHKERKEIICSSTDTVTIWDFNGQLLSKFIVVEPPRFSYREFVRHVIVQDVAYLPDADAILTLSQERMRAWTRQGHLLWEYLPPDRGPSLSWMDSFFGMTVSPDGKIVALRNPVGQMKLWDTASLVMGGFSLRQPNPINDFAFFPNGDIATSSMKIFDKTGKLKADLSYKTNVSTTGPNGTRIKEALEVLSSTSGILNVDILPSMFSFFPSAAAYDTQHKRIAIGGAKGGLVTLNYASNEYFRGFPNDLAAITRLRSSLEGGFIFQQFLKDHPSHLTGITRLRFSPDGSHLYSSSSDGMLKIWNTQNWDHVTLLSSSDNEWLIYTPDGYFDASPHGGELLAMVTGLNAYGIEQFAARNNRPDLILERMGLGPMEQISYYQLQYQKRLKKLGLTEALLSGEIHVPEAKITKTTLSGKSLKVEFSLSDDKYSLKRYHIFVNNVPLFGSDEREIYGNTFSGTEIIELTAGRNKIELSVMNEAGAESYRALTYAEYKGREKRALYYLAFGVSKYKDASLDLNYADKDAKDLETVILQMRPAYDNVYTKTFLNSEATAENIKKAKDFLKTATIDDTVILFLAGHGGYDKGKDPQYYYLPYEADQNNLTGTGVVFENIEDLLTGIKPRKKLFLLDTCESGELDEDVYAQYYALADARGFKPRAFRKPVKARGQTAEKGRGYLREKDRFIFNDLARRSGAIVFSSSRGNEISYESSIIKNGFFSREIINALTSTVADKDLNGKVSVDELKTYVSQAVSKDTNNLQNPTIDRDNLSQKIELQIFPN